MTQTRQILLAARPTGEPGPEHFTLATTTLPDPAPGEVLLRTIWLSLDPYMRGRMNAGKAYAAPVELGHPMTAAVVAEVMISNDTGLRAGDLVMGYAHWAEHAVVKAAGLQKLTRGPVPLQAWLGVLGMPGMTAWSGLTRVAAAQPGETILVSAATGAVGSLVAQLAKRRGLRVIGVAGGPEKCARAVADYGCDICLDHREGDARTLSARMAEAAPDGIDIYFENVGGKTLQAALHNMNMKGRIAICGMIAWYSGAGDAPLLPATWREILYRRLRVEGFIVSDHYDHYPAFVAEVEPLVATGALRWQETVSQGLDSAPGAFIGLLQGRNQGKQLVRIAADPQVE